MINRARYSLVVLALCGALLSGAFPPPVQAQEEILFGTLAEVGKEVGKDLAGLFIEFLKKKLADKDVYFSPDDAYMFFEGNKAAPGKFEVKNPGALDCRNDDMAVSSCGYSTSNFAGSAYVPSAAPDGQEKER